MRGNPRSSIREHQGAELYANQLEINKTAKIAPDFWLKGGILAQRQARWQIYLFPSP